MPIDVLLGNLSVSGCFRSDDAKASDPDVCDG